jgi:ribosomal protein S18 acetylase RimI-like enzyme
MKPIFVSFSRFIQNLPRRSRQANLKLLEERGENPESSFIIREATEEDIVPLSHLHVKTWSDTYFMVRNPPSFALRERQWKELFSKKERNWFVFVIEKKDGSLVGFTMGRVEEDGSGNLNKIYLLREYQRLGLGKKMFCLLVKRFLSMSINRMTVFAEASNPSCRFYEKMRGQNMRNADGSLNYGNYEWNDLAKLSSLCT